MKKKNNKTFISNLITYAMVIIAFVVISIMQEQKLLSYSAKQLLVPVCVWIVMAVSLNLTVGISGELSLGHAGFMCVGAFVGAVLTIITKKTIDNEALRLIIAMVVGGVAAGLTGVIVGVPVLRLRGDYLAIVTLAFGEIIRNVLNLVYVGMDQETGALAFGFNNPNLPGKLIVNGPQGVQGITRISTFTMGFVLIIFALIVVLNMTNSRAGRAMMALRDNRIAAESVGISATKYKLMAFVTSAVLAGMAGALYAMNYSTVTGAKFKFDTSILVLVFVVLGGIGNIRGSIIAATVLTVLPEMLREFSDYRMLIYAIVLIVVMLATNSPAFKQWLDIAKEKITGLFAKKKEKGDTANE